MKTLGTMYFGSTDAESTHVTLREVNSFSKLIFKKLIFFLFVCIIFIIVKQFEIKKGLSGSKYQLFQIKS